MAALILPTAQFASGAVIMCASQYVGNEAVRNTKDKSGKPNAIAFVGSSLVALQITASIGPLAIAGAGAPLVVAASIMGHGCSTSKERTLRAAVLSGVLVGAGTATAIAVQTALSPIICVGIGAAVSMGLGRLAFKVFS